jgi:PKD repeat protein
MKKPLLFVAFLFFCMILSAATIEKTYYFQKPVISQIGNYQQITFENTLLTSPPGQPILPYRAVALLLPPGESAIAIEWIGEDEIELSGSFHLYPYQPSRPLSNASQVEFLKDDNLYRSDDVYPIQATGKLSTSFMNGFGFAFTNITPLRYCPKSGKVSYYQKITVRIKTASSEVASQALTNLNTNTQQISKVKKLAQNESNVSLYPSNKERDADDYKLLIITPDQFAEEFVDLIDIYKSRAMPAEIHTTESIYNSVSGQDQQEKIRNFIIQEYQDHGVEFVLLGGDVEYIPYRGFYCYVQSGSGYETADIPADLYYSALDGSWNNDGDANWGEPDEDDLLPDVALARFPFSNSTELANMIHKSISYQNNPVTGELVKPLLAGENLYSNPDTWGRDYLNLLIGSRSDNGYTTNGIPETNPIDSLYAYHQSWNGNDMMNAINEGLQFVHHVGHASPGSVAHLVTSDISNSNFNGANGVDHNFTLFHTHGCDCGSFDNNDCILEKMVLIENFAVAVIGNSRYGWFNEGQTEGPAAHLHREMVDALYHEKMNHLGKALLESKVQTAPWVEAPGQHEEGALRWNFYDLNILGDPALSVWTDEPIAIDISCDDVIQVSALSLNVTVNSDGQPMENFRCSLLKDGIVHANGITNSNGETELLFEPMITEIGDAILVVSGYNCLPDTVNLLFVPDGVYARFTADDIDVCTGNMVVFTDQSFGTNTSWDWTFEGGIPATFSGENPPPVVYDNAGSFDVTLMVSDGVDSDIEMKTDYITVIDNVLADFDADVTEGAAPLTIHFSDLSSDDAESWHWDFGDGGSSGLQNPTYSYYQAGTYTVALTVEGNGCENSETKVDYIIVTESIPEPDFMSDVTYGPAPLTVNFTDMSEGTVDTWFWEFGDGSTSVEQNPEHIFTDEDFFDVSLTVTGPGGAESITKEEFINTLNLVSLNVSASPDEICSMQSSQLNAEASGGSETYTYSWTSDPEGFVSDEQSPMVSPVETTTYMVEVSDGEQLVSSEIEIVVNPLPEITLGDWPEQLCNQQEPQVQLTAVPEGGIYSGENVTAEGLFSPEEAAVGWHVVTYTYADENGCENMAVDSIFVDACLHFGENDNESSMIKIYPNPFNDILNIYTDQRDIEIKILTLDGITLKELKLIDENTTIDLSQLRSGIYIVNIESNQTNTFQKIIKR